MQVYHGSYTTFDEIDLSKAQPNRDFGQGFYVTKYRKQAEKWAKNVSSKYHCEGLVTEYIYYDSEFTERLCKVKHFDSYSEEWLDFVVMNRNPLSPTPAHDYDIVEGPVANDKVQRTLTRYLSGKISKHDFLKMLTYHENTHQICFCTMRSLLTLSKVANDSIFFIEDIAEQIVEQLMLDLKIDEEKAADFFYTSKTFSKLADKNTDFHQQNWHEIYKMLKKEVK
ncbi:MAG: DUF3990 domain-containing protein [Bacteroidales bacterium]|jgi:hypothetical protein|nr:DUF3990 domain-containing protein [Bacteroidales bacterium]